MKRSLSFVLLGGLLLQAPVLRAQSLSDQAATCESQTLKRMSSDKWKGYLSKGGIVVAGAYAGGMVYGVGVISMSSGEAAQSTAAAALNATYSGSQANPTTGLIISAAATGAVVVAIGLGVEMFSDKITADYDTALLQLLKDFRNGGAGPQLDARVAAIQNLLVEVNKKTELNPETLKAENIRSIVLANLSAMLQTNLLECDSKTSKELSTSIDRSVLKTLIQGYNPGLATN